MAGRKRVRQAFIRGKLSDYSVKLGEIRFCDANQFVHWRSTTFYNLEYITFEGGGVMLNVTTETGFAAAALYEVILGRAADAGGHEFYAQDKWAQLIDAANSMLYSDEFTAKLRRRYKMSATQFLEVIYQTAFDRPVDQVGLDYWLKQISDGMSYAEVAVRFAYSTEAQSHFSSTINYLQ